MFETKNKKQDFVNKIYLMNWAGCIQVLRDSDR
jgi:hypothetical protein